MRLITPKTLQDAKNILEKTAYQNEEHKGLIESAKELSKKTQELLDMMDKIFEVGNKILDFLSDIFYCISHPSEFLVALEPWMLLAIMALVLLKAMGFKTDKWLIFTLVTLALVIIFC